MADGEMGGIVLPDWVAKLIEENGDKPIVGTKTISGWTCCGYFNASVEKAGEVAKCIICNKPRH